MFVTFLCLSPDELYPGDTGGSLYDGQKQVLYWADVSSEVAFVVPSPTTYQAAGRRSSTGNTTTGTVTMIVTMVTASNHGYKCW